MGLSSWLVAGMVPGVERQPLKKLEPDEDQLLKLMNRWRHEALQAGHAIERVVVAYEAGRKGGQSVNPAKRSFSRNHALALEAGRKGGHASHPGPKKVGGQG